MRGIGPRFLQVRAGLATSVPVRKRSQFSLALGAASGCPRRVPRRCAWRCLLAVTGSGASALPPLRPPSLMCPHSHSHSDSRPSTRTAHTAQVIESYARTSSRSLQGDRIGARGEEAYGGAGASPQGVGSGQLVYGPSTVAGVGAGGVLCQVQGGLLPPMSSQCGIPVRVGHHSWRWSRSR